MQGEARSVEGLRSGAEVLDGQAAVPCVVASSAEASAQGRGSDAHEQPQVDVRVRFDPELPTEGAGSTRHESLPLARTPPTSNGV